MPFLSIPKVKAITFHYERNSSDPRIAHSLNTKIDDLGNVLENVSIVYPRLQTQAIENLLTKVETLSYQRPEERDATIKYLGLLNKAQQAANIILTVNTFTHDILEPKAYRLRQPASVKTYELRAIQLPDNSSLYKLESFVDPLLRTQHRLIEHMETLHYNKDFDGNLPLGNMAVHGIPYESYQLAFTDTILNDIYGSKTQNTQTLLVDEGKYIKRNNTYWIPSGFPIFKGGQETLDDIKKRFFTPIAYQDPFDAVTKVELDKKYVLFIESIEDPLENKTQIAHFNFRTLSPIETIDINDNISRVLLDELGLVKAMAIYGKGNEADNLKRFN